MEKTIKLPAKFGMGNSPLIWGVVSFCLVVFFIVIAFIGDNIHKQFYSWILLETMFTFCGIKFFYERFKQIIFVDNQQIISKQLFSASNFILWKEVISVTLDKSEATMILRSATKTISVPLKFKNWELLLDVFEEKVANEKFIDFE